MRGQNKMKKASALFLALVILIVSAPISKVAAEISENEMNGNPMDNEDHFIWDVMENLQTPDDSDCLSVAQSALIASGLTTEEASMPASNACEGLENMQSEMESGMPDGEGETESIETNLFDATNWHAVENLYFQHSTNGVTDGRIAFTNPIDFMSYDFMNFMRSFGENMETSRGIIGLNADVVGGMANYGAVLTMYNIPDFRDPVILVDGHTDRDGVVSNISYDENNHTLTFNATHFTTFKVVERSKSKRLRPTISNVVTSKDATTLTATITGSNLDENGKVYLGKFKATSLSLEDSNTLIATFSLAKLKTGKKYVLRVINSNKKKAVYRRKITI